MGLIGMNARPEMQDNVSEAEVRLTVDEKTLPELIHGQIGKLNELDAGVKKALDAAGKAEQRAKAARAQSAEWSLFGDKKKEAIEELQKAGIELAEAVQLGTQAQKLSFEFQARLIEVTKYLFTLGVSNIAANRAVVRELKMRLSGASAEELSDLAQQEVMSVIRQLQEQEDLLKKQEQVKNALNRHDSKITHLLTLNDELALNVKNQDEQHLVLAGKVDSMSQISKRQQDDVLSLQKQAAAQQTGLGALADALTQTHSKAEEAAANMLARAEDLDVRFKERDAQQRALASTIHAMEQVSKSQQEDVSALRQQVLWQQSDLDRLTTALAEAGAHAERATTSLRSALNLRAALLVIWATAVPVALHFLR